MLLLQPHASASPQQHVSHHHEHEERALPEARLHDASLLCGEARMVVANPRHCGTIRQGMRWTRWKVAPRAAGSGARQAR